jgi:PAS domain S-box-containing protein
MDKTNKSNIKGPIGQSDNEFKEIFYQSPIGIILHDKKGIAINANKSALEIMGIAKLEDILEVNLFDNPFIEEKKEELLNKGIIKFQAPLDLDIIRDLGFYYRTKEGVLFLDYTVSVTDSGYLVQIQDINELKNATDTLKESEKKLRTLFETMPVGVSVLDKKRNVIYDNPALEKILGLSKEDVLQEKYTKRRYIRSDMTEIPFNEIPSVRAFNEQKPIEDVEIGIIKEDNSIIWTNVSAIPLSFSDWGVLLVTSDITERKKAEEALHKSEKKFRSIY